MGEAYSVFSFDFCLEVDLGKSVDMGYTSIAWLDRSIDFVLCRGSTKTFDHIFCCCNFTQSIIDRIAGVCGVQLDLSYSFHDLFLQLLLPKFSPRVLNI